MTSGADVAWITDELDRPDLIDRVLAAQGRPRLWGAITGIISFGVLAAVTSLGAAVGVAGVSMVVLGAATVARWPERGCVRAPNGRRWATSWRILRDGVRRAAVAGVVAWRRFSA